MLTLAQRLEAAMRKRGVKKKADIARACKVSTASVADWFNGNTKQLSADAARLAAKFFGCSQDWIGAGIGDPGWTEEGGRDGRVNVEPGPSVRGRVPLISWVQAGAWAESCDVLELHDVERWLDCFVPHSECTAALRVRGDSMTALTGASKSYPEGCFIFVDFEKKSPVNGQRIVAKIDGGSEVTFKVFKDEDGRKWLQPLNPSHEPIRDPFKVLGTVIGKWEDE